MYPTLGCSGALFHRLECEVERRALVLSSLGPDAPPVSTDDPLDRRQTDAGALELLGRVQALERGEQLVRIAHVEPRAVVAHEVRGLAVDDRPTELDARAVAVAGELPGVPEQVLQHRPQQARIAGCRQALGDDQLHLPLGLPLL